MGFNILVLGCGPAGLIAAHAASQHGDHNVRIISKPRKSYMRGAQYLHEGIPGVPSPKFEIDYQLMGPVENYRAKVYGPMWDGTVSPDDFIGRHTAYDIRAAYDWLWDTYGNYVAPYEVTPAALKQTLEALKPDITISTVPAPYLCAEGHHFASANIWSTDRAIWSNITDDTVICNGEPDIAWYRCSKINGWENTEWPDNRNPVVTPKWSVVKPLKNTCTCFPDVIRMGRYGRWEKGVLSHHAYWETVRAIDEKQAAS